VTRLQPPTAEHLLTLPAFTGLAMSDIRVPRSELELAQAWSDLQDQRQIGFDTESKPVFVRGQTSTGPDVVQFATPHCTYVLQLRHAASQALAKEVLIAPQIVKVGFDLQQDQSQLRQRLGTEASPVLDLTTVFHRQGYPRTIGIKSAVAIVFGQRFVKSKKLTTTNWSVERLEPRQLLYAANDAHVALRVWQALRDAGHDLRAGTGRTAPVAPAAPTVP
jgi:ribonuclease D